MRHLVLNVRVLNMYDFIGLSENLEYKVKLESCKALQ